jgi:hypothetical protein
LRAVRAQKRGTHPLISRVCAIGLAVAHFAPCDSKVFFTNESGRHGVALTVGFVLTVGAVRGTVAYLTTAVARAVLAEVARALDLVVTRRAVSLTVTDPVGPEQPAIA